MRWLINYIRQAFCKHEWKFEEKYVDNYKQGVKVYMRCTKCGYHQKHWKYL